MVRYQALSRNVNDYHKLFKQKFGNNNRVRKSNLVTFANVNTIKVTEERSQAAGPSGKVNVIKNNGVYTAIRRMSHMNSFWFDNAIHQNTNRYNCFSQPIATLKTYTFQLPKPKILKRSLKKSKKDMTLTEKIIKFYRETINIQTSKTILRKRKPFHLSDKEKDIETIIEEKWKTAQQPISIDSYLSNHLLEQAERKQSPDVRVSLKSPCYPFIPCPLRPSKDTTVQGDYAFTSLAPLFLVDPLIVNKERKSGDADESKQKCISINFWSQFPISVKQSTPVANEDTSDYSCMKFSGFSESISNFKSTEESQPSHDHKEADREIQRDQKLRPVNLQKCEYVQISDSVTNGESIKNPKYNQKIEECNQKSEKPVDNQPVLNEDSTKPTEPNCPLINSQQSPKFIGNYYTVQSPPRNLSSEKKKSHLSVKNNYLTREKIRDIKPSSKHMNLNYPNKMTSPNQIKHPKSHKDLKMNLSKILKDVKSDSTYGNPTNNREKLLKQLKKIYDLEPKKDSGLNGRISEPSKKNLNKQIKNQYPMTSPNNLIHKCKT